MWFLPLSIIVFTIIIAFPLSKYMTGIMEGKHHAPRILRWVEKRLDTGSRIGSSIQSLCSFLTRHCSSMAISFCRFNRGCRLIRNTRDSCRRQPSSTVLSLS